MPMMLSVISYRSRITIITLKLQSTSLCHSLLLSQVRSFVITSLLTGL